jgi:hypothetical protein
MRKTLRLMLSLAFFVPAFAMLGAFAGLDASEPAPWLSPAAGGSVGLVFGLILGGFRSRSIDLMFGPPHEDYDSE